MPGEPGNGFLLHGLAQPGMIRIILCMKMPGFIKFYLGEGGRRGLGRKTGGVLQANGVKKEILEIVLKLNIYIQLCSVHSAFNCRTYLKQKLFLSQTP